MWLPVYKQVFSHWRYILLWCYCSCNLFAGCCGTWRRVCPLPLVTLIRLCLQKVTCSITALKIWISCTQPKMSLLVRQILSPHKHCLALGRRTLGDPATSTTHAPTCSPNPFSSHLWKLHLCFGNEPFLVGLVPRGAQTGQGRELSHYVFQKCTLSPKII